MTASRVALVAGATGLVGAALVRQLSARPEYDRIVALVRRAVSTPDGVETRISELTDVQPSDFTGVTDVFCSVGTTIRKAGSRSAFRSVDHDAVLHLARVARAAEVTRFLVVTSVDASSGSRNFYLSVKGDVENALRAIDFPELYVFRPSLLVGKRAEVRRGERMAIVAASILSPLLVGSLRKYKPVGVEALAGHMICAALGGGPGQHTLHYDEFSRYRC